MSCSFIHSGISSRLYKSNIFPLGSPLLSMSPILYRLQIQDSFFTYIYCAIPPHVRWDSFLRSNADNLYQHPHYLNINLFHNSNSNIISILRQTVSLNEAVHSLVTHGIFLTHILPSTLVNEHLQIIHSIKHKIHIHIQTMNYINNLNTAVLNYTYAMIQNMLSCL